METVKISKQTWNRLKENLSNTNLSVQSSTRPDKQRVYVHNDSGVAIPQFGILGIGGIVITPDVSEMSFIENPVINGVGPDASLHGLGKFVICEKPIPMNGYGTALLSGISTVKVNVLNTSHGFAEVANATVSNLASCASSSCQIIWKESGTGLKYAIVRFGGAASPITGIRHAYCKVNAGTGTTIVCYLDTDSTGTEITVNCHVFAATNLSDCLPALTDGLPIPVYPIGTSWYCAWWFSGKETCNNG